MPRHGRFTPKKERRYSLYKKQSWPHGRSEAVVKISPPPGLAPRTVQPVASRYIDCAIAALSLLIEFRNSLKHSQNILLAYLRIYCL
jgi:hypothetical protein